MLITKCFYYIINNNKKNTLLPTHSKMKHFIFSKRYLLSIQQMKLIQYGDITFAHRLIKKENLEIIHALMRDWLYKIDRKKSDWSIVSRKCDTNDKSGLFFRTRNVLRYVSGSLAIILMINSHNCAQDWTHGWTLQSLH